MNLKLLVETPAITVYQDTVNNWLYVDWRDHLSLPIVRQSCLVITRCFFQGSYTKVLNDNTNVLGLSADVSPWLAKEYLPFLTIGGIQFIAWVYSPNISTQVYTDVALYQLASPVVALFSDTASACDWLRRAQFAPPAHPDTHPQDVGSIVQQLKNRKDLAPLAADLERRLQFETVPNTSKNLV